jgi:GDP/UDP-N,N'-diacetylbacillosamine 2-epimerase (hydrolysing)
MRIGVLTSSRADFGIYLPLLQRLKQDSFFEYELIVFGTHLSFFHGHTIDQIEEAGYQVHHTIESLLVTDSSSSITTSMGLTTIKFAEFWAAHQGYFDLVFCLGDRYEMFSAVMAGVAFQIPFAHIHGGETTLGAIDNVFRHSITLASIMHFVSTPQYANRVKELTGTDTGIHYVGALGLDNLSNLSLLSVKEFEQKWGVDLSKKTILTTFHPETVNYNENENAVRELIDAINSLSNYQVVITMPNADTEGNKIRKALTDSFSNSDRVYLIENLGQVSYFTAMKYCSFLLGNTSSGIIEAASFGKYVINLGDRQKGRACGDNIIHSAVKTNDILNAVKKIESSNNLDSYNIYDNGGAATKIVEIIKQIQ